MRRGSQIGGALLAVMWLSAALAAIAFGVANTVRGETERTSTAVDGLRAHYIAAGAVDRAVAYIVWGPGHKNPDGSPRYFIAGMPSLTFSFPAGDATVEVIPETAKLSINSAQPQQLLPVLLAAGIELEKARELTAAIIDWRTPSPGGLGPFDQHYLSLLPSFRARHASFEEIEELLLVKGMTPELFYGTHVADESGRLMPRPGLRDCLSVYGSVGQFDVNHAQAPVLLGAGVPPYAVQAILDRRRVAPFLNQGDLAPFTDVVGPAFSKLRVGGNTIVTLRATATLRLPDGSRSDVRRSVTAMVKLLGPGFGDLYHVLRWYEGGQ